MESINQEEQEVSFYKSSPQGPYLTTNSFSRRWENEKALWAWQLFLREFVSVSRLAFDGFIAVQDQGRVYKHEGRVDQIWGTDSNRGGRLCKN